MDDIFKQKGWREFLAALPEDFTVHPRLKGVLDKRLEAVLGGEGIDWAGAEALAFASLLSEGHGVRLSGQDRMATPRPFDTVGMSLAPE